MGKLSIAIDMGAKNNGVFICKSKNSDITYKKANCIIINKGAINFSKKNKRENRHKIRNYKRRKLAKRLLKELIDFSKYNKRQSELIFGLLNNRGYTIISTSTEFETLNDITIEFISKYFSQLKDLKTKEDFEVKISSFDNLDELKEFIEDINGKIEIETKKKKKEFYKEFQNSFSNFIKKDLILIKNLFNGILNEIVSNKNNIFIDSKDSKKQHIILNTNAFLGFLKETTLFSKTYDAKRKVTREFSLPLKDKSDKLFVLRRKDFKGNIIYQYLLANRDNSTRSFFEDEFIHKHKNGKFHKNIIPSDIAWYKKAFKKD